MLYNSTTKRQHSFHILKAFSSDTYQSMKTPDRDLKVNRNIYPYMVICDWMRLIGPKCDLLAIVYLTSPKEKTNSIYLRKTGF